MTPEDRIARDVARDLFGKPVPSAEEIELASRSMAYRVALLRFYLGELGQALLVELRRLPVIGKRLQMPAYWHAASHPCEYRHCLKRAVGQAMNSRNAPLGWFCERHGHQVVEETNAADAAERNRKGRGFDDARGPDEATAW